MSKNSSMSSFITSGNASIRCILLVLIICIVSSWALKTNSYRAAVVEYAPVVARSYNVTRDEALRIINLNADKYEEYIIYAKSSKADIIVFPEYGLFGPNFANKQSVLPYLESIPNAGSNPCIEQELYPYLNVTTRLSCMARDYQMIVVVDMGDVQYCSKRDFDCPSDRRYQFNTQVVFDTDGSILAKYHKTNLYFEPEFDVPVNQQPIYFDALGVRFGLMICFDIMFAKPQLEMIHNFGVTDLLFSSWWVNTPPILTATQIQQGWSRAFNLNMIASNAGFSSKTSGSGIFHLGQPLTSFTNPTKDRVNRMLIADVPRLKPRTQSNESPIVFENSKRIPESELALKKPLEIRSKILRTWDMTSGAVETLEIPSLIKCVFNYNIDHQVPGTNDTILFYVANGFMTPLFPSLACGVARCSDDAAECVTLRQLPGQSLQSHTYFSFFSLKAYYGEEPAKNMTVYPVSSKGQGELFTPDELSYTHEPKSLSYSMTSLTSRKSHPEGISILHIGYLGRNLALGSD